jgi:hypothetical protein
MSDAPEEPRLRLRKVDYRTTDGETIVLDLATERYLRLNRAGSMMWEPLVAGTTRGALIAKLIDGFDLDEDRAVADVDAFLAELGRQDLLDTASR